MVVVKVMVGCGQALDRVLCRAIWQWTRIFLWRSLAQYTACKTCDFELSGDFLPLWGSPKHDKHDTQYSLHIVLYTV